MYFTLLWITAHNFKCVHFQCTETMSNTADMRNRSKYPFTLVWIPENALCPPVRYIPRYWALQFQTLPKQHYLWFNLVWFKKKKGKREVLFSPHKAVWTILMHKGVPWRLQLSLSVQTPSSFTTMPALFPVALATLRPGLSLSLDTQGLLFVPPSSWRRTH